MKDTGSTRPLLDKLGVKAEQRISVVGDADDDFVRSLRERGAEVFTGRPRKGSDVIFYRADERAHLRRLPTLAKSLDQAGALWVLRPKGVERITERDVYRAGKDAGLVDVKVVSFSNLLTAEKFVIPLAKRAKPAGR